MSLTSKLTAVADILHEFFLASGQEDHTSRMLTDLNKAGVVNEGFAAEMTVQDVLEAISVPTPVARRIVKALGNQQADGEQKIVVICDDPKTMALRMNNRQLIESYNPDEPDSPIGVRLVEKAGDAPIIVWNDDDGTVLVDPSVTCLEDVIAGPFPTRTSMVVNGSTRPVLPVGVRPNVWADENPVVPNEILRRDGTSSKNVPWGSIDKDIQSLLRAALDAKQLVVTNEYLTWESVVGKQLEEVGRMFPCYSDWKNAKRGDTHNKLRKALAPREGTAAASGTK